MNLHCTEHNTPWFKKGRMKGHAHPLDNGGWCNMPESTGEDTYIPPTVYTAETEGPPPPVDPTRLSIERQVALKAAVEHAGDILQAGGKVKGTEILQAAQAFYDWLQGKTAKPSTTGPDGQDISDL